MAQEAILIKEKGVVTLNKSFDFMCSQLRNGRYRLIIERYTEPRTLSQNALMWLWFTCIEQETGTDKQDVHDYYCNLYLRRTTIIKGKETVIAGSTSKLNTLQMTDFLNKVKADAATELGITLPLPEENGTTTVEGKNLVTSDLINAFSKLNPHAALLTEQKEVDGIESVDEVPDIIGQVLDVTGYSIGGDGDNEGVTLIAKRFLKTGKVLNLCAPFTMFNNENESYINAFELEQEIQSCEFEVKEYLFNKKWRIVQQELPFEEDTANADVQPDAIPEAGTDFNQEVAEFQQAMNDAGVDIIMNGKKIKSRKPRKVKQLAS